LRVPTTAPCVIIYPQSRYTIKPAYQTLTYSLTVFYTLGS